MKFPRQARIFCGPLDPAPVAGVMMLMVIFMLVASLLYTPGVRIQLPAAQPLAVTDNPTVVVEVDSNGQCFFENKPVSEAQLKVALKERLRGPAAQSGRLTLILLADRAVRNEVLTRLESLASAAGITEVLVGTSPAAFGLHQ
jgi:biopolymer transport protein ExbD